MKNISPMLGKSWHKWRRKSWRWLHRTWQSAKTNTWAAPLGGDGLPETGLGLGNILRSFNWDHINSDIAQESRARIAILGASGAGKSTLLNTLKGTVISQVHTGAADTAACASAHSAATMQGDNSASGVLIEDYGLFCLVDLPAHAPSAELLDGSELWLLLHSCQGYVWLLADAASDTSPTAPPTLAGWEYEWICRVRAMGKPLVMAYNTIEAARQPDELQIRLAALTHMLGCVVIPISAQQPLHQPNNPIMTALLPQLVALLPQLNLSLGREVAAWRARAAKHIMQQAA